MTKEILGVSTGFDQKKKIPISADKLSCGAHCLAVAFTELFLGGVLEVNNLLETESYKTFLRCYNQFHNQSYSWAELKEKLFSLAKKEDGYDIYSFRIQEHLGSVVRLFTKEILKNDTKFFEEMSNSLPYTINKDEYGAESKEISEFQELINELLSDELESTNKEKLEKIKEAKTKEFFERYLENIADDKKQVMYRESILSKTASYLGLAVQIYSKNNSTGELWSKTSTPPVNPIAVLKVYNQSLHWEMQPIFKSTRSFSKGITYSLPTGNTVQEKLIFLGWPKLIVEHVLFSDKHSKDSTGSINDWGKYHHNLMDNPERVRINLIRLTIEKMKEINKNLSDDLKKMRFPIDSENQDTMLVNFYNQVPSLSSYEKLLFTTIKHLESRGDSLEQQITNYQRHEHIRTECERVFGLLPYDEQLKIYQETNDYMPVYLLKSAEKDKPKIHTPIVSKTSSSDSDDFFKKISRFTIDGNVIGKGDSSVCYACGSKTVVLVAKLSGKPEEVRSFKKKQIKKNIEILKKLGRFKGEYYNSTTDEYYVVQTRMGGEHQKGKNLVQTDWIFGEKRLNFESKLILAINIAENLNKIHSKHIIHGDLHIGNILINGDIVDFDYGILLQEKDCTIKVPSRDKDQARGEHVAPEWFNSEKHTVEISYSSDVYSLGKVLSNSGIGGFDFDKINSEEVKLGDEKIIFFKNFIEKMCSREPTERPYLSKVIEFLKLLYNYYKNNHSDGINDFIKENALVVPKVAKTNKILKQTKPLEILPTSIIPETSVTAETSTKPKFTKIPERQKTATTSRLIAPKKSAQDFTIRPIVFSTSEMSGIKEVPSDEFKFSSQLLEDSISSSVSNNTNKDHKAYSSLKGDASVLLSYEFYNNSTSNYTHSKNTTSNSTRLFSENSSENNNNYGCIAKISYTLAESDNDETKASNLSSPQKTIANLFNNANSDNLIIQLTTDRENQINDVQTKWVVDFVKNLSLKANTELIATINGFKKDDLVAIIKIIKNINEDTETTNKVLLTLECSDAYKNNSEVQNIIKEYNNYIDQIKNQKSNNYPQKSH